MKKHLLFLLIFSSVLSFAQKEDLAFFAGLNFQKEASENFVGGEISARFYVDNKFSVGLQTIFASKKFNDGFDYLTDRTILNNITLNSLIQYDLLSNDKFFVGLYLGNGIRFKTLRNLNDVDIYENYDEFGNVDYTEVPKKLNRDLFYVVTPGIDVSFKIAELGKMEKVGLYFTSKSGYQFSFGQDDLFKRNNSKNMVFSIGLTLKGNTKSLE